MRKYIFVTYVRFHFSLIVCNLRIYFLSIIVHLIPLLLGTVNTFLCMYACMHVCMYVCMYVLYMYMCLCMYICMYVCMYV